MYSYLHNNNRVSFFIFIDENDQKQSKKTMFCGHFFIISYTSYECRFLSGKYINTLP
jgi:hypothetical protein